MKTLTLNTNNSAGGATKACIRLHQSLIEQGLDTDLMMLEQPRGGVPRSHNFYEFYVQQQREKKQRMPLGAKVYKKIRYELGKDEEALENKRMALEEKLNRDRTHKVEVFSFAQSQYRIREHPLYEQAQVVNLHCVNSNFLDYPSFFTHNPKPIVWTLHDMNPFTGGCVYAEGCPGFITDCHNCPQLQGTTDPNYTQKSLAIKLNAMQNYQKLVVVSPSRWLMKESQQSALFKNYRHVHIPYGIDSNVFQPRDKAFSRQLLGIPEDKPVILFVSYVVDNKRKGYSYLLEAFEKLNLQGQVTLCAVGMKGTGQARAGFVELGSISDERIMSLAYSAADVFVIPSLEDNLPNTVLESLLCGTPVIGFPIGGIPDMIEDGKNGFLCSSVHVDALAQSLHTFLENPTVFSRAYIRQQAVDKYDSVVQAHAYLKLYHELLDI